MTGVLVDSNVILDIFEDDQQWADGSESILSQYSSEGAPYINAVIYSEVSMSFERIEEMEVAISGCEFELLQIPKEALFPVGKTFLKPSKG